MTYAIRVSKGDRMSQENNSLGTPRTSKTLTLVQAALFCALTFVATYFSIPAPVVGNVNLGDGILLIGAWWLGLPWGLASALGAMLADFASGYIVYMPATLVIKLLMVLTAVLLRRTLSRTSIPSLLQRVLSAIAAELVMVFGYYLFEAFFAKFLFENLEKASFVAPLINIPFNLIQALIAVVFFTVLTVRKK